MYLVTTMKAGVVYYDKVLHMFSTTGRASLLAFVSQVYELHAIMSIWALIQTRLSIIKSQVKRQTYMLTSRLSNTCWNLDVIILL